jgi:hypothetical protein
MEGKLAEQSRKNPTPGTGEAIPGLAPDKLRHVHEIKWIVPVYIAFWEVNWKIMVLGRDFRAGSLNVLH